MKASIALLGLCQLAAAFYPWYPNYGCVQGQDCISERAIEAPGVEGGVTTLKLEQRLPKTGESHAAQVRHLADGLARKYSRGTPVTSEVAQVNKRDNHYPVVSAATPSQTNSAGINQDGTDFSYFAQVLVGSENTPRYMLLDTGAGTSWLMGSMCTSPACKNHNTFGPTDSKTYDLLPGGSFSIGYGTGQVSGLLANDTISFAGMKLTMTLGIANQTSNDFNNYPMDGILGLSQMQTDGQPNFIQTLVASNSLKSNVFGMSLNRNSDGPNTGEINFGAPDTSKFSGSLSYTPVSTNAEADWAIPMDNIGLGDKQSTVSGRLGYIDTGTSYIFAPQEDAEAFHALIPGSSVGKDGATYTVPCSTTDPITITFSGVTYSIASEDWVGPSRNGVCTSNIYGMPVVEGGWLLGDTFLKNVYVLFDIDENRVGLAEKATSSSSSSSSVSSSATTSTGGSNSLSSSSSSTASSALVSSSSSTTSSALVSSSAASVSGSTTSVSSSTTPVSSSTTPVSETSSNGGSAGSASSTSASQTGTATSTTTGSPGLNSQQTVSSSGQPAAATSSSTASPSSKSSAARLDTGLFSVALASLLLVVFL